MDKFIQRRFEKFLPRKLYPVMLISILFLIPFVVRIYYLWWVLPNEPFWIPDEYLYPEVGRKYVQGVLNGNFSVFRENLEHPAISKMITGILCIALEKTGLTDLRILRFQSALLGALTGVVLYYFGKYLLGETGGILTWFLYSLAPNSVFFGTASLDVTFTLFITLSAFFIFQYFRDEQRTKFFLSIIFFGLAVASKYTALVFFPAFLLLFIFNKYNKRRILVHSFHIILVVMVVVVATNPIFWSGENLSSMFMRQKTLGHFKIWGKFTVTANSIIRGKSPAHTAVVFIVDLFIFLMFFPHTMKASPYILIVFVVLIYHSIKKRPLNSNSFQVLLCFFSFFYFFLYLEKNIVYYLVILSPFLSLFVSSFVYSKKVGDRETALLVEESSVLDRILFWPMGFFLMFSSISFILAIQEIISLIIIGFPSYPYGYNPKLSWITAIFVMPFKLQYPVVITLLLTQIILGTILFNRIPKYLVREMAV